MKVMAIDSSPRAAGQSKTRLLMGALVGGMREAGAEVIEVELRKKKINRCIGCFTCWTKTPGVCVHKDDMTRELFPQWLESDLVVYGTPLYHFLMNAELKVFIERTLPILQPFFAELDEKTTHPLRRRHPRLVMLSVAGFPEDSVFDQLSSWFNSVYGRLGYVAAEIYRPNAEAMTTPFARDRAKSILEATRQAGRELVQEGKIRPETMAEVLQPVTDDDKGFFQIGNLMWKTCITEGITPQEFTERGMLPRPDSLETFLTIMAMGFKPEAAEGMQAAMQFVFSGDVSGTCHITIMDRSIKTGVGALDRPDITITSPFPVWMDIIAGKLDGTQAFMDKQYTVEGDASILMKMNDLFGR
ncbi:MAG: NAD(P)H-dependent oxidoreductase [Deltaproteobacteria bacterium]|nr:NAD(P)H-dependent oxidoreductase [Deltaproteobacteria bacterium]